MIYFTNASWLSVIEFLPSTRQIDRCTPVSNDYIVWCNEVDTTSTVCEHSDSTSWLKWNKSQIPPSLITGRDEC